MNVFWRGGVSDDQQEIKFSCGVSEAVLSDECVLGGVSDDQHEIEFSCGVSEAVFSDECDLGGGGQ